MNHESLQETRSSARSPSPRRISLRRGWVTLIFRTLTLFVLAGLTAWNVTRSDSLPAAIAAQEKGDHAQAVRHALDHLDRRPWSREAARIAARGLNQLAYLEAAETYLRRVEPLGREDLLVRAFALLRANRREEATRIYESVLNKWPDDPTALRQLAVVYSIESNHAEALRLAEQLAKVPGHEVVGYTMLGTYQHNRQEPGLAVEAFERVLELDPELRRMPLPKAEFWNYYAADAIATGGTEAVRRGLGRVLHARESAEVRSDPRLWALLGNAYHLEGDFARAEEAFRWSSRLDPQRFETWNALGQVLLAQNRPEDAIDALDRARTLAPNSWSVVYNLILANARAGRTDEVTRLRARAEEIRRIYGVPTTGMGGPSSTVKAPSQ